MKRSEVRRQFLEELNKSDASEYSLQPFLEEHSELIPLVYLQNHHLHFDAIVSKFAFDLDKRTDFAYLTKSSAKWWLVCIELEHPQKKVFTRAPVVKFHSDTESAIAQIEDWKDHIKRFPDRVRDRLRPLMEPRMLADNPLSCKFVLVIGRNQRGRWTPKQAGALERLAEERKIELLTYDSLARMLRHKRNHVPKNILTQSRDKFVIRSAQVHLTNTFGWLGPDSIELSPSAENYYRGEGYDIDSWKSGELLRFNLKETMGPLSKLKKFPAKPT